VSGADLVLALIGTSGAALALKARGLRDCVIRIYNNPQITRHMSLPGYVSSLRLIGAGLSALMLVFLIANLSQGR
jgi:hypothetical protein